MSASPSPSPVSLGASGDLPEVHLRYENLSVHVTLSERSKTRSIPSIPGLVAAPFKALGGLVCGSKSAGPSASSRLLKVLDGASGSIAPGRLTLIVSPPGGGKTMLLKAFAGLLPAGACSAESKITWSGLSREELRARGVSLGQLVQYVDQRDDHLPFLSVRETFEFVANNALAGAGPEEVRARVDETIALLKLKYAEHTLIGNDIVRGVSGGEKKRVTIGEGLLTRARFLALDEISTGLDSAVTFEIVASLRAKAAAERLGVVIALLQPTPEVYALFDDVILLREGCVVYHGPREALPGYLAGLGFLPPPLAAAGGQGGGEGAASAVATSASTSSFTDMADWLTSLLSQPAKTHAADVARVAASAASPSLPPATPPLSLEGMVSAWAAARARFSPASDAAAAPTLSLTSDAARAQYGRPHVHSGCRHTLAVLARQFTLMGRNKLFLTFRVASAVLMSIILGGLFYQGSIADGLSRYGLFLNSLMIMTFANIAEMSSAVEDKFVAYRHVANGLFPAWTYALAAFVAHLPVALVECGVFSAIMYTMVGLTPEVGRFFFFALCVFLSDVFAGVLFRTFAYSFPNLVAAQAAPLPIIALLILFAGFLITPSKMGGLIFLYYLDIFGWLIRSVAQNEFFADRYNFAVPGSTDTLGTNFLTFVGFDTNPDYKWAGIGFALGSIIVLFICSSVAFAYIRYSRNVGSARVVEAVEGVSTAADVVPIASPSTTTTTTAAVAPAAAAAAATAPAEAAAAAVVVPADAPTPPPAPPASDPVSISNTTTTATTAAAAIAPTAAIAPSSVRSVLPFEPMTVAFRDMQYEILKPVRKTLLQGISGYALPGRMLALMGASGAGKTTLLDVLASRKNSGVSGGDVFLNGHPKETRSFNRVTAYVEQQDIHEPLTTVREALRFSAALRLPAGVPASAREAFVEEILALLELDAIADCGVGDVGSGSGLSPGERKRLTIGVELVSNAPVLFLDEPTSGLDSRAAALVMKVVRNVASTGRTIICTIHQPSADVFALFDDLLLLQRGGWQVYFGPLGPDAATMKAYLGAMPGEQRECPAGMNPASWMLDVLGGTDSSGGGDPAVALTIDAAAAAAAAGGDGGKEKEVGDGPSSAPPPSASPSAAEAPSSSSAAPPKKSGTPGETLQAAFRASPAGAGVGAALAPLCEPAPASKPVVFASRQARNFLDQYLTLVGRQWRSYSRNIEFNCGRFGALTGLNILFGIIWYGILGKANDVAGITSTVAAIFMVSAFSGLLQMDAALPVLIKHRPVFYRETASFMYDPTAHSLALITVEIPYLVTILLWCVCIGYFMLGLVGSAFVGATPGYSAADFFFFQYLSVFVQAITFVSLGHFIGAVMPTFDIAQAIGGLLIPVLFLFGGLFQPPSQMPPGSRWVNTIDPIGYAFRAIIPQQFYCDTTLGTCPSVTVPTPAGVISVLRYEYIANLYGFDFHTRWDQVGYLAIFTVIFQIMSLLATRYVRHITR